MSYQWTTAFRTPRQCCYGVFVMAFGIKWTNITTLADFSSKKDWKQMLGDAPVPTPTKKTQWQLDPKNPDSPDYNPQKPWQVGVYEGGGYLPKGVYRPYPNCMMNWFHRIDIYCPVCQQAIKRTVDLYIQQ